MLRFLLRKGAMASIVNLKENFLKDTFKNDNILL
jgi:hypothetical protein